MQRYFVSCDKSNIILAEDDIFHVIKVMRMKVGDKFEINNDGEIYLAEITSIKPFEFKILEEVKVNNELSKKIRLLYCLPKGEKLDLVLQKATELGVYDIVLINSSRTIAKIDDSNKEKKLIRYNRIIKEATEQCKRNHCPKILDVIKYNDIKNYLCDINLIAYENCKDTVEDLKNIIRNNDYSSISILVGPEGGFSKEEVDYSLSIGFKEISLGKRILRSETSVLYLLSVLSYELEG